MTIPYNSSHRSMKEYLEEALERIEDFSDLSAKHKALLISYKGEDGLKAYFNKYTWFTDRCKTGLINDKDLNILVGSISYIIQNDFTKIRNLTKYLKNIAYILCVLELPIT